MPKSKRIRWFLIAGCIGVGAALLVLVTRPTNPVLILCLCPSSIVGLGDPRTFLDKLVAGTIIFGGNFLLYGAIGAIAGKAADDTD